MACFSLAWIENLLIWLVVVVVLVALFKLVLPLILGLFSQPPGGGAIITALSYILWGVVAIFCIILAFDLLGCVFSGGGMHLFPRGG